VPTVTKPPHANVPQEPVIIKTVRRASTPEPEPQPEPEPAPEAAPAPAAE
jgi:hypothetical protein